MHQSLARYSAPVSLVHAPSGADFITAMVGFKVFGTHRYSTATFWPTKPASFKPFWNPARNGAAGGEALSSPITGKACRCARAATGHAAAPPIPAMNARRLIGDPPRWVQVKIIAALATREPGRPDGTGATAWSAHGVRRAK